MYHNITGTLFNYYQVCQRKMWLHAHGIQMEAGHDAVEIGKLIHETSYARENKKEIVIDGIKLDFVDNHCIVHEVKKSDKMEDSHIWQIKYYLYVLYKKGNEGLIGQINYPKQRKIVDVQLKAEDFSKIEKTLEKIQCLLNEPHPPKVKRNQLCRNCSYNEFCWG